MGTHWTYQDRIRDILAWVCPTDRQYERAEKEWLKVATGQEQAIRSTLHQAFRGARITEESADVKA